MVNVSVVTPAYNCSQFIDQTVQSVIDQTFEDWELLIVEDRSEDDTWALVSAWSERDQRIQSVRNPKNCGPAHSRNHAISLAKGDFIAFLDADDQWHPRKLEVQIKFMKEQKVDFSYTSYNRITEAGEPVDAFFPEQRITYNKLLKSNQIGCLTAVYNAKSLGKIYMPDIRKRQDFGLWLDILKHPSVIEAQIVPWEEALATYRIRTNSVSSNKVELIKYNWSLLRRHQKLSLFASGYYLICQIYRKVIGR